MEVIAKCAFGLTIDHLGEKDDPFMQKARQVFSPRVNRSPLILMPCKRDLSSFITLSIHFKKMHFIVCSPFPETDVARG